jgi:hypothetical protein
LKPILYQTSRYYNDFKCGSKHKSIDKGAVARLLRIIIMDGKNQGVYGASIKSSLDKHRDNKGIKWLWSKKCIERIENRVKK